MCRHRLDSTSQSDSKMTTNLNNKAARLFRKFNHNLGFIFIQSPISFTPLHFISFTLHGSFKFELQFQSIFVCKKCKTKVHFIIRDKYLGILSHLLLGDLYPYIYITRIGNRNICHKFL